MLCASASLREVFGFASKKGLSASGHSLLPPARACPHVAPCVWWWPFLYCCRPKWLLPADRLRRSVYYAAAPLLGRVVSSLPEKWSGAGRGFGQTLPPGCPLPPLIISVTVKPSSARVRSKSVMFRLPMIAVFIWILLVFFT